MERKHDTTIFILSINLFRCNNFIFKFWFPGDIDGLHTYCWGKIRFVFYHREFECLKGSKNDWRTNKENEKIWRRRSTWLISTNFIQIYHLLQYLILHIFFPLCSERAFCLWVKMCRFIPHTIVDTRVTWSNVDMISMEIILWRNSLPSLCVRNISHVIYKSEYINRKFK